MILYHGSNITIKDVDLSLCKPFKDFGQGFYLTPIKLHAQNLAVQRMRLLGGEAVINEFEFDIDRARNDKKIKIKYFDGPTEEWVKFVIMNRDENSPCPAHDYDIVVGPIADDKVAASIKLFQRDFINMSELLNRLKYRELSIQYFFHNPYSLQYLKKI